MTPEQLKALMDWIDARIAQDQSAEDMRRVGEFRRALFAEFGFSEHPRTGDPFTPEPEEPEPSPGWEVVAHPNFAWCFALRNAKGEWWAAEGHSPVAWSDRKNAMKKARELNQ